MRYLSVSLLVAMSVVAVGSADAQSTDSPSSSTSQSQSSSLMTHPASVNQPGKKPEPKGQPLSPQKLDAIAGSISGKPPQKPKEPSFIPDNIVPTELLPRFEPKPVEPLDDFKVPALNGGVKVPIRRD
ncbi:hypothetical protein K9N68_19090 [Kovacikia minuta CCNUW1]|uniref:hypothetical protein n=1 Tax=Kovacikia minuta TaxID=2931930 RepID=UPI001CCD77F3|nr:hypothetical protein [Kovacikia minuta]UBF23856.1 hypothetical protein K9N68_19090 [Kovacikia minuta CCNUW1]